VGANKLPRPEALNEALRLGEKPLSSTNFKRLRHYEFGVRSNAKPRKALQTAEQAIAIGPNMPLPTTAWAAL